MLKEWVIKYEEDTMSFIINTIGKILSADVYSRDAITPQPRNSIGIRPGEQRPIIGMANPSATFAKERGLPYNIVNNPDGSQRGDVTLPNGNAVDAWKYYRENHPQPSPTLPTQHKPIGGVLRPLLPGIVERPKPRPLPPGIGGLYPVPPSRPLPPGMFPPVERPKPRPLPPGIGGIFPPKKPIRTPVNPFTPIYSEKKPL